MIEGQVERPEWRPLLYIQCFLHSIVQERRKFGPIGFTVPYEFNDSDMDASVRFLQNHVVDMDQRKAKEVDWPTVRYMVAEIQYGGRITDDWDRRLMQSYCEKFFSPETVQGALAGQDIFYDPGYKLPPGDTIEQFRAEIDKLPFTDNPELFGLHGNADLTYRVAQAVECFDTIIETQPKTSGGSEGESRESVVEQKAQDLLSRLPPDFNMDDVVDKIKKNLGGMSQPVNIFLKQEVEWLGSVLAMVKHTLTSINLAIAGTIVLSPQLNVDLNNIYDGKPPSSWMDNKAVGATWEIPGLALWFQGLLQRHEQLDKWINTGRPKSFWITGFFNPQGFLTSVQQEVARKHEGWALDDICYYTEVKSFDYEELHKIKQTEEDGVYIHGLYLDGCAWSKTENKLVDSMPKQIFNPLPILYLTAVKKEKDKERELERKRDLYDCPLYKNRKRANKSNFTNFIETIEVRSEDNEQAKWIRRGVALLCSKD